MITLTQTLLAAQRGASTQPYVELKAYEKVADVNRLRWTRLYTGAETDDQHAAAMPADGSLLRAYIHPDAGLFQIHFQRVASPGAGSAYNAWTVLHGDASGTGGVAIATTGARVAVFYVANDNVTIRVKRSTDSGATFGAAATVAVSACNVIRLAAAYKDADTLTLFYADATDVYAVTDAGAGWGAAAAWTLGVGVNSITGIAAHYIGDYNLIVTGTDDSDNPTVWTTIYGDGYSVSVGAWSNLLDLMVAEAASNVSYSYPTIARPDAYRLAFVEQYGGAGAYTQVMASHAIGIADFIDNFWREPWPLNVSCAYGIAFCNSASTAWFSTPSGVWKATITVPVLDLTTDLLAADAIVDLGKASLVATVRNDSGQYLESGNGKGQGWLGCELRFGIGYRSAAGSEVSSHRSFWVEGYEFETGPGKANLVLHAHGPWTLLANWKARRQLAWPAGSLNVFQLLSFVLARVGLALSAASPSVELSSLQPAFTISPGQDGATVVKQLLDMVPDTLRFQNASGILSSLSSSDPSSYSYGSSHPLLRGRHLYGLSAANRVQVFGSNAFGEAFAWEEVDLVYDRLRQVHDEGLSAAADCSTRAEGELAEAAVESKRGVFSSLPNCGLEPYDMIDITEARAGLAAAKRRVLGITTRYDARVGVYEQEVTLGGGG